MSHLTAEELQAGLEHLRAAPRETGELVMIVARPDIMERRVLDEGQLDTEVGLVGDNWLARGSSSTPDGSAAPDKQITVMNIRAADLVARGRDGAAQAGDQLYVDFDVSIDNLPPGALLSIGEAVLEISESPHLGCAKFVHRFGEEAMRFVNGRVGRSLRLRGVNTRVVVPGTVRVGDKVTRTLNLGSTSPGRSLTRGLPTPG